MNELKGKSRIKGILDRLQSGADHIYSYEFSITDQLDEIRFRESVEYRHDNYLDEIAQHHSIPVMDREVALFLKKMPYKGIIIDVGGGWGWHWRQLKYIRPDVTVFILDFLKENLDVARKILKNQINRNIFLVHGDATSLIFDDNTFDGYWSVQTIQHIPNFIKVVQEAHRVLTPGGVFVNYSLNTQPLIQLLFRLLGKEYHIHGEVRGSFFLSRASKKQRSEVRDIFSNKIETRFTEIIFKPELKLFFPGKENSLLGRVDKMLSSSSPIFSLIARQQSYHTTKLR
jgi:ubiquinone/menaquinone biosynthesis C-methylase UbiE